MSGAISTVPTVPTARTVFAGRWPTRWTNAALLLLGAVSLLLYCKGAHDQGQQRILTFTAGALGLAIPYFLASWLILRARPARSTWLLVLAFALAFRVVCLQTDVYLSTDLYRYIWDGRVQAAHINPFRYVPADPHLAFLRDDKIYPHINRKSYAKTVYPPGAQIVFWTVTRISESVTCIRITMVAFEALAVWGLVRLLATYGLPAQRALLYAWHPLVVWEFAGGGHVDAVMIAFVVLSLLWHRLDRPVSTGVALGLATLTKLFPVILAPALYRRWRWGWRMPAAIAGTVALGYLPYVLTYNLYGALGFLPRYTTEEGLQSGDRFFLMTLLPARALGAVGLHPYGVFVGLGALAVAAAAAWALWRRETDELSYLRRCLCLATIFVALLSSGVDWYATWLVPFLCFLPYSWLFWLTGSTMVLYLNWIHNEPRDIYLLNAAIYFPAAFLGGLMLARRWVAWRKALPAGSAASSPQTTPG
jgi:alpha-1,6-mannosyltransferase